jgi:hypothetical protein
VSAWIGTAFAHDDAAAARKQWREVADQARPRAPKLAKLMDEAEADVLAYMSFPRPALGEDTPPIQFNGSTARSSAAATSSACRPWQPQRAANPAQQRRCYTTWLDAIKKEIFPRRSSQSSPC